MEKRFYATMENCYMKLSLLVWSQIIGIDVDDKEGEYCVHYNGWNKAWDEWVPETRILKLDETGLEKQKSLQEENLTEKAKQKSKKKKKAAEPDSGVKKKRSRHDHSQAASASAPSSPKKTKEFSSRIFISSPLQKKLLESADNICKHNKLLKLPAAMTVNKILDQFLEENRQTDVPRAQAGTLEELAAGIKQYFNLTLGTQLLYKQEKQQFKELTGVTPSECYGADHLLRLFVKYGPALSMLSTEEDSQVILLAHLQLFLQHLEEKSETLFTNEYISSEESKKN
ncbi:mortality factor 4-like protein 1 isoform X2 [Dysidea avara]|uniref:mortality factor 4-like protein 1 isoform X2 n=1 Tax=Dysidea avara TaxID=196820 RepID=UPI00332E47DD